MERSENSPKPGIFKRLMDRSDQAMKEKAEAKANKPCCCSDENKDKDDKCC